MFRRLPLPSEDNSKQDSTEHRDSPANMDMSGMAMGSMAMGGTAPLIEFPKYYWAVVGAAIGVATLVNIFNNVLYRHRYVACAVRKSVR